MTINHWTIRGEIGCLFLAFLLLFAANTILAGSITNNFNSGASIIDNGVIGTMWDGAYLGSGDLPGGDNGGDGNGTTLVADETTIPGFLTVQTTASSWAGAGDDGFYLWKVVCQATLTFLSGMTNLSPTQIIILQGCWFVPTPPMARHGVRHSARQARMLLKTG